MSINIFIGTSPNGEDSEIEKVYEYTLLKNTQSNLSITWMKLNNHLDTWSGWNTKKWFTPFSGFRWAIPHACNFEGRAIYTDVDMINLRDIKELYEIDLQGKPFAARKGLRWGHELCVMVIDCHKAKEYVWKLKKLKKSIDSHKFHRDLISGSDLVTAIDPKWNVLDGENYGIEEMYQLHFTNMSTQPWSPDWYKGEFNNHPRKDLVKLFRDLYKEADDSNFYPSNIANKERIDFEILL